MFFIPFVALTVGELLTTAAVAATATIATKMASDVYDKIANKDDDDE